MSELWLLEKPPQEQTVRRRVQRSFVSSIRAHQFVRSNIRNGRRIVHCDETRHGTEHLVPEDLLLQECKLLDSLVEDRHHVL